MAAPHLCLIVPIAIHPDYVMARPPHFRVVNGMIVQRSGLGSEALSLDDILTLAQIFETRIREADAAENEYRAMHYRQKKRDLDIAFAEIKPELCA